MSPSPAPHDQPAVKRVVLPSGRTIEVVYFKDDKRAPTDPAAPATEDLHACPSCRSELVYPTGWEEAGENLWELDLRCPNCEWDHTGTYPQEVVETLDERLDDGTQALVRDMKALVRANMESEVERLIEALDADAIWPMDF